MNRYIFTRFPEQYVQVLQVKTARKLVIFSFQSDGARQVGAKKQSANQHRDVHGRTDVCTDVCTDGRTAVGLPVCP